MSRSNFEEEEEQRTTQWRYFSVYDNVIVQSLAHVTSFLVSSVSTSSGRIFGCFNCIADEDGCLRKRKTNDGDGAWFDCDQLNVDHSFCYENPIAIEINEPITTNQVLANGGSIAITKIEPQNAASNHTQSSNLSKFNNTERTTLPYEGITPNNNTQNLTSYREHHNSTPPISNNSTRPKRKHYSKSMSTRLSPSFADTLELDHFNLRNEFFPLEGDDFNPKLRKARPSVCLQRPLRSPVYERKLRKSNDSLEVSVEKKSEERFCDFTLEDFESRISGVNIWKESELDVVFGAYNSNTKSENTACKNKVAKRHPKLRRSASKYEDIFPSLFVTNTNIDIRNNNTIRRDFSFLRCGPKVLGKENICVTKIKDFISSCIHSSSYDSVNNITRFNCDNCSKCYRGFNKQMIFDLVRETCKEYILVYKNTVVLSNKHMIDFVLKQVLKILKIDTKCENEDIYDYKNGDMDVSRNIFLDDELFVENALLEEMKVDNFHWLDLEAQEEKFKIHLSEDIFENFLSDEVDFLSKIFEKKFKQSNS